MKQEKIWIPGTYDPVFKSILTDPNLKDYLCYLISEITDLNYKYVYNNIEIINGELPIDYKEEKQYRSDILINIEKNKINIEANRESSKGLYIKNDTYLHKIASDIKRGEKYERIKIYQINFNEYNRFKKNNRVVDKVMLTNVETGEIEEEEYQKYHINLALIRKKCYNNEKLTLFEKRCLILTLEEKEKIKEIIGQDKMMRKVFDKMEQMNENDDVRLLWDGAKELEKAREYDMRIAKEKAREEGIREGREEGIKEGIDSNKIEIAKNMLNDNIDINTICKYTGLSKEEVEKLK